MSEDSTRGNVVATLTGSLWLEISDYCVPDTMEEWFANVKVHVKELDQFYESINAERDFRDSLRHIRILIERLSQSIEGTDPFSAAQYSAQLAQWYAYNMLRLLHDEHWRKYANVIAGGSDFNAQEAKVDRVNELREITSLKNALRHSQLPESTYHRRMAKREQSQVNPELSAEPTVRTRLWDLTTDYFGPDEIDDWMNAVNELISFQESFYVQVEEDAQLFKDLGADHWLATMSQWTNAIKWLLSHLSESLQGTDPWPAFQYAAQLSETYTITVVQISMGEHWLASAKILSGGATDNQSEKYDRVNARFGESRLVDALQAENMSKSAYYRERARRDNLLKTRGSK